MYCVPPSPFRRYAAAKGVGSREFLRYGRNGKEKSNEQPEMFFHQDNFSKNSKIENGTDQMFQKVPLGADQFSSTTTANFFPLGLIAIREIFFTPNSSNDATLFHLDSPSVSYKNKLLPIPVNTWNSFSHT